MMLMLPAMGVGLLLLAAAELTGGVSAAAARLEGISGWLVALAIIAILVVIDAALLVMAHRRFRRSRLIALT